MEITKQIAEIIFWTSALAMVVANLITIARALEESGDPTWRRVTSTVITLFNTAFIGVVWLVCTLLNPRTNHIPSCLILWAAIVIPTTMAVLKTGEKRKRLQTPADPNSGQD